MLPEAVLEEGDNEHALVFQLAGQVSAQFAVQVLIHVVHVIEQEGQADVAPLRRVLGQNVIGSNSQIQSAQRNGVQNLFLGARAFAAKMSMTYLPPDFSSTSSANFLLIRS